MKNDTSQDCSTLPALSVYLSYFASTVFPFMFFVAPLLAYSYKGEGPKWLRTHYDYQLKIFWKAISIYALAVAIAYLIIAYYGISPKMVYLCFTLGVITHFTVAITLIISSAKGWHALDSKVAVNL